MLTKQQVVLLKDLRVSAHIARAMEISAQQLKDKIRSLDRGNTPIIKRCDNPVLFKTLYIEKQKQFWSDVITIAVEKLKELEIENA